jgi:hypothetical protein
MFCWLDVFPERREQYELLQVADGFSPEAKQVSAIMDSAISRAIPSPIKSTFR